MKCNIKGLEINYLDIGSGQPILFIHGFTLDHRALSGCMEPIFESKKDYRRIYIDLPGMGLSQSAEWAATTQEVLNIVLEFIDLVLKDEKFLLAGNSYGGYLCAAIAKKLPQRVKGVLLLCPMLVPDDTKRTLPNHAVLKKDEDFISTLDTDDEDIQDFLDFSVVHTQYVFDRFNKEIVPGLEIGNEEFLEQLRLNENYALPYNIHDKGYTFDKPSLILVGRQDSGTGYKDAWNILDCYPRATFAVVDISGHNLQIEQPVLFEAFVREWLGRASSPVNNEK